MVDQHIDTVIFDFGGVLINIDYQRTIDAFISLGMDDFDTRYSQANQTSVFDDIEVGRISPQRFVNELLPFLPHGTSPNEVVEAWNAMILDVPKVSVELLNELQGKYRLFLLSNTNEIHIPKAMKEWSKTTTTDFYSLFDKVYFSYEMGLRKPHVEIFEQVCKEQGIVSKNALFIDDSLQHIQGAQKAGLNTIHLTDNSQLASLFS